MNSAPKPRGVRRLHPGVPAEAAEAATIEAAAPKSPPNPPAPAAPQRRVRTKRPTTSLTVTVTTSILEEARDAVAYLQENPRAPRSFTALLDIALLEQVEKLREQFNGGAPFPKREGKLRTGPRI